MRERPLLIVVIFLLLAGLGVAGCRPQSDQRPLQRGLRARQSILAEDDLVDLAAVEHHHEDRVALLTDRATTGGGRAAVLRELCGAGA